MKLLDIPPNYLNKELALKICSNKPLRKKYINKHLGGGDGGGTFPLKLELYYKYNPSDATDNVKAFYTWCETLETNSLIVSHGGRIRNLIQNQPESFNGTWEIMYVGVPKSVLKTQDIFTSNDNPPSNATIVQELLRKEIIEQEAAQTLKQTKCTSTDRHTTFENLYDNTSIVAKSKWNVKQFMNEIGANADVNNVPYTCVDIKEEYITKHEWNPNNTLRNLKVYYNTLDNTLAYINHSNIASIAKETKSKLFKKNPGSLYHCIGNGAILKYTTSKGRCIYVVRHFPSEANLKEKTVGNLSKRGESGKYDYLSEDSCKNFLYDTEIPKKWGTGNYKLSQNADLCEKLRTIFETGQIYTSQLLRTYQTALLLEKYLTNTGLDKTFLIVDDKE